jgi:hypothetical protein
MRRLAVVLAGCGRIAFDPHGDAGQLDAPLGPWSAAMPISAANTADDEEDVGLSSTGLELYFGRRIGLAAKELWVMTRATSSDAWSAPVLASVSDGSWTTDPRLSADDLTLYFESNRPGGLGDYDVWTATRPTTAGAWSAPADFTAVDSALAEGWLSPCSDGHFLETRDAATGESDIYEGQLGVTSPVIVPELNDPAGQSSPHLTPDCLTVYFWSARGGNDDLYTAHRASVDEPWSVPTAMTELDTPASEQDPWMSPDGRLFVFASDRAGTMDLYFATRGP